MKLAVVPVDSVAGELENGEEITYGELFKQEGIGKLTKEQVEVMVSAFRAAEDEGFSTNQCLQEALDSVGIEVE